jgi:hypothetical protein
MGIVWRCQDYKVSRAAVHKRLERISQQRGLPLTITRKNWHLDSRVSDEQAQSEELRKDGLPYETSLLHNGFSVARMSLQDILPKLINLRRPAMSDDAVDYGSSSDEDSESDKVPSRLPA